MHRIFKVVIMKYETLKYWFSKLTLEKSIIQFIFAAQLSVLVLTLVHSTLTLLKLWVTSYFSITKVNLHLFFMYPFIPSPLFMDCTHQDLWDVVWLLVWFITAHFQFDFVLARRKSLLGCTVFGLLRMYCTQKEFGSGSPCSPHRLFNSCLLSNVIDIV